jgi:hypothetical protein
MEATEERAYLPETHVPPYNRENEPESASNQPPLHSELPGSYAGLSEETVLMSSELVFLSRREYYSRQLRTSYLCLTTLSSVPLIHVVLPHLYEKLPRFALHEQFDALLSS